MTKRREFKLKGDTAETVDMAPPETVTSDEAEAIIADTPEPTETEAKPKRRRKRRKATKAISENNKVTAQMLNAIFFKTFAVIGGPDAMPTETEAAELNGTLAAYLDTKPNLELPPEFALILAYVGFVVGKLQHETVREKTNVLIAGVRAKIGNVRSRIKTRFKRKDK